MKSFFRLCFQACFVVALVLIYPFCSPSTDSLLRQAEKALQAENSAEALRIYQEAFESSLDSSFFPTSRNETYTGMEVSLNGSLVGLFQNRADGKKATVYSMDIENDETWNTSIKGQVYQLSLSPNGRYMVAIFTREHDKGTKLNCSGFIRDQKNEETIELDESFQCSDRPAISDDGLFLFNVDNTIYFIHAAKGISKTKYIEKTPDVPVDKIPCHFYFEFSSGNEPFFTFGTAGLYKLYSLKNRELQLLSSNGALDRIFFIPGVSLPGIIVGGANNHQINFFNISESNDTQFKYPVRYWRDVAFFNQKRYFFIEDQRLYFVDGDESNPVPLDFWTTRISMTPHGNVLLLTTRGSLIQFKVGGQLSQQSRLIFEKGWDL